MPLFSRHWLHPDNKTPDPQQLQPRGPALNISIEVPDHLAALLVQQEHPLPPAEQGTALIDTGASFTAIEETVLLRLGLVPVSTQEVWTPSGQSTRAVYACKISFPGTPIPALPMNAVVGCELSNFGHVALIGRDLLRSFLLVYNGVEGSWTLAF